MTTYLKPLQVREKLLSLNLKIFTPNIFSQIFNCNKTVTKHFLETQVKLGLLIRLKRGLYTLKTDQPSEQEIANSLYQPSYISFEYALAFYGLLPEMPYTITSATTKATRNFNIESSSFLYRKIKTNSYTGYSLIKQNNHSFLIAEPEKAYLDYQYFVFLKKLPLNERLNSRSLTKLNWQKTNQYLQIFKNDKFSQFIKSLQ